MITKIHHLQSPFVGYPLERNACLEYEEDGEIRVLVLFSQEQGLAALDRRTPALKVSDQENLPGRVLREGLPLRSEEAPVVIIEAAALLLHRTRTAMSPLTMFASDSRERIQILIRKYQGFAAVCALFIVDEATKRHVYLVHDRAQALDAFEQYPDVGEPTARQALIRKIEESVLPEHAHFGAYHLEHDAASEYGLYIEQMWMEQLNKLADPDSSDLALPEMLKSLP